MTIDPSAKSIPRWFQNTLESNRSITVEDKKYRPITGKKGRKVDDIDLFHHFGSKGISEIIKFHVEQHPSHRKQAQIESGE